jgi:hypothetical protein
MYIDFVRQNGNQAALINNDNNALSAYKKQRENNRKLEALNLKIDNIERDISEIKIMLVKIMEKLNQ